MERAEFLASVTRILDEIQQGLFDRAEKLRKDNLQAIDSLDDFKQYFTPKDREKPEIHGGFAVCHFVDEPTIDEILKPLKVTPRCIPLDQDDEPGTCIFTGKPTSRKAVFAKAY
jgi:prolyl-tRNA synthetase